MELDKRFWQRMENIYPSIDIDIIKKGFNSKKRKVSFRINRLKTDGDDVLDVLKEIGLSYSKVDYLDDAYILDNGTEKDLWDLSIFKDGKIYLQSIASQIPVNFLDLKNGDNVLDVTAAPGSKTSQIASILDNSGEIIANDNNAIRIDKLKFTLERQGVKNTKVIKTDATKLSLIYKEYSFDKIVADLPCSAEGRINLNNEKSYSFWNEANIKRNYIVQKEILKNIVNLLKVGGILVYSTCTIAPEENEAIVHFLLSNFKCLEIEPITLDYKYIRKGVTKFGDKVYNKKVENSLRCLPSEDTEGFFVAKFRKI
ncbi:methyltransferase domain-containing protein [Candidatus Gracilibacteria bacterium]|nr:methyltransferase domain-containing protein [Candidatus Gracilibacteria bacterium]